MITVEVISPERLVHTVKGVEVLLPTVEGQIGIRRGHLPLITVLKAGEVVVKHTDGSEALYAVGGGFAEIIKDHVRILADSAERADELIEHQIHEAIERAKRAQEENAEAHLYADVTAQLEANLARLKVIQRKKARGRVRFDQD